MSEAAAVPPRAAPVAEVKAVPQTAAQDPRDEGNAPPPKTPQGERAQRQDAPPFKEPAISLSPRVAGIKVGDMLVGAVERIDAQQRAVVQTERATVLVEPAAHLKSGKQATLKVTQVFPKFTGLLLDPRPTAAPTEVKLALVALRGIEPHTPTNVQNAGIKPTTASTPSAPLSNTYTNRPEDLLQAVFRAAPAALKAPVATLQAPVQQAQSTAPAQKQTQDLAPVPRANVPVIKTLTMREATPPNKAAPTTSPTQAPKPAFQPALVQAHVVRLPGTQGPPTPFELRHPIAAATPRPLPIALLQHVPKDGPKLPPPAPTSPIGRLIQEGRVAITQVETRTDGLTSLRSGPLRIDLPPGTDASLRAGDRVIILSSDAAPKAPVHAPDLPPPRALPTAQPLAPLTLPLATALSQQQPQILWPALHSALAMNNVNTPDMQINAMHVSSRAAQVLHHILTGQSLETTKLKMPEAQQRMLLEPAAIEQMDNDVLALKRLTETLLTPSAGAVGPVEARPFPLIIPNSENSLLAFLFLLPPPEATDEEHQKRPGAEDAPPDTEDFELAIGFEAFGEVRLSGRVSEAYLSLNVSSEFALPPALESELEDVFYEKASALDIKGRLNFRVHSDA